MKKLTLLLVASGMGLALLAQGPGVQKTNIKNHPRVNEVNSRIDNKEKRINREEREGKISKRQAKADKRNLRAINHEKRDMRRTDGGHLTKHDQKALNHQLNENR